MNLKKLRKVYAVALRRFEKYIKIKQRGSVFYLCLEVKKLSFDLESSYVFSKDRDERINMHFRIIMLCEALNIIYNLEAEGIDTSDTPEADLSKAKIKTDKRFGVYLSDGNVRYPKFSVGQTIKIGGEEKRIYGLTCYPNTSYVYGYWIEGLKTDIPEDELT
jgi:hypothetical protein